MVNAFDFLKEAKGQIDRPYDPSVDSPIPYVFQRESFRDYAIVEIARSQDSDPFATGALIWTAVSDSDERARRLCLLTLFYTRSDLMRAVLAISALDTSSDIRRLVVECIYSSDNASLRPLCLPLMNDIDPAVAEAASTVYAGGTIRLTELESEDDLGLRM